MEVLQNSPGGLNAGEGRTKQELVAALRQLEAELSERDRLQEDLYGLIGDLEHSLAGCKTEIERHKGAVTNLGEELESFSYSISHDLRAPLRHLIGFSSALAEDFSESLDPSAKTYLDCVVRAGRKMEALIEALLGLSRIARQEMSAVQTDLGQLARHCAQSLLDAEPERQVVLLIPERLPVHADPQLMKVALEHLLGNSWKFSGARERASIELGVMQEGEGEVYFVRDNGSGFDQRFAQRLFAPFQRMHREDEFPGLGIGLATVQRIIHRHGGRIWAEAQADGGASFFFTLPR